MADFPKMYNTLFNAQTDAIALQEQSIAPLKQAQQNTEDIYMEAPEPELRLFESKKPDGSGKE